MTTPDLTNLEREQEEAAEVEAEEADTAPFAKPYDDSEQRGL